jgi:2-succinyl-6-hydroxy-2,4-cyclohexadiene-1-carboxylate synthase
VGSVRSPVVEALHVERRGAGRSLVLVHGFTQTGRLWGDFGDRLAAEHRLVAVDLPGHGRSSAVAADLEGAAALVEQAASVEETASNGAETTDPAGRTFDLLGYSLGARVALHVALRRPPGLRRLVLIGATAGIDDDAARAARRTRDDDLADQLEQSGDVAGFVAGWLASPMFAGLPAAAAGAEERATNTAAGLASSLRLAGTGTQAPLWNRLEEIDVPTLVVAGADDPRFVEHGRRLVDGLPDATWVLVPGAGHAAHLHQPAVTARLVTGWLAPAPG